MKTSWRNFCKWNSGAWKRFWWGKALKRTLKNGEHGQQAIHRLTVVPFDLIWFTCVLDTFTTFTFCQQLQTTRHRTFWLKMNQFKFRFWFIRKMCGFLSFHSWEIRRKSKPKLSILLRKLSFHLRHCEYFAIWATRYCFNDGQIKRNKINIKQFL